MGIQEVISFSRLAHEGQMRRGDEEPYINHPLRVYGLMRKDGYTGDSLVVAVLHDVVEDTSYVFEDCYKFLSTDEGKEALRLVTKMEGETSETALNRLLSSGNRIALLVKAYDALDNSRITEYGAEFTRTILGLDPEKEALKYKSKAKACFDALSSLSETSSEGVKLSFITQ
jgi:(p)ppGpp synthase/HD superfamily hydrolase